MANLDKLKKAADAAEDIFEGMAIAAYGSVDEFYRRDVYGEYIDPKVMEACNAFISAKHIYVQARACR